MFIQTVTIFIWLPKKDLVKCYPEGLFSLNRWMLLRLTFGTITGASFHFCKISTFHHLSLYLRNFIIVE